MAIDEKTLKKLKQHAVRTFLSHREPELSSLRTALLGAVKAGSEGKAMLISNPYASHPNACAMATKLVKIADIAFPENWFLYVTPETMKELIKGLRGEPYMVLSLDTANIEELNLRYNIERTTFRNQNVITEIMKNFRQ